MANEFAYVYVCMFVGTGIREPYLIRLSEIYVKPLSSPAKGGTPASIAPKRKYAQKMAKCIGQDVKYVQATN